MSSALPANWTFPKPSVHVTWVTKASSFDETAPESLGNAVSVSGSIGTPSSAGSRPHTR